MRFVWLPLYTQQQRQEEEAKKKSFNCLKEEIARPHPVHCALLARCSARKGLEKKTMALPADKD